MERRYIQIEPEETEKHPEIDFERISFSRKHPRKHVGDAQQIEGLSDYFSESKGKKNNIS